MFNVVVNATLIAVGNFIYLNACMTYAGSPVYFRLIQNKQGQDKESGHAQNVTLININLMLNETHSANDSRTGRQKWPFLFIIH